MDGRGTKCPVMNGEPCLRNECVWWVGAETGLRRPIEGVTTAEEEMYLLDCAVPIAAYGVLALVIRQQPKPQTPLRRWLSRLLGFSA